jgi:hypothetical protein
MKEGFNMILEEDKYEEMVDYFGEPRLVAEFFDVSVQAVYQWQHEMPRTRWDHFQLLKKFEGKKGGKDVGR